MQEGPELVLTMVALICVAALALFEAAGWGRRRGGGLVRQRVASITAPETHREAEHSGGITLTAGSESAGLRKIEAALRRADLDWTIGGLFLRSGALGLFVFLASFVTIGGKALPLALGVVFGVLLPWRWIVHRQAKKLKAFAAGFPDALDVIVRGVKAGLPLIDCIKILAADAPAAVQVEFRTVLEDQAIGMPIDRAVEALALRVPTSEAKFFAIVVGINTRAGGNLSEALGNLSSVLRERKKMYAKIKALSAEAKASAMIVGSMPIVVGGLVYLTSPKYISLLFTTLSGNIVLSISLMWMGVGILVMRNMTNFEV